MAAFTLLLLSPMQAATKTGSSAIVTNKTEVSNDAKAIAERNAFEATDAAQVTRMEEIRSMDMSTLSRSEKNDLRDEVKSIQNEREQYYRHDRGRRHHRGYDNDGYDGRRHGGGEVYFFSGGGLLVLLLILLLI